jgi:hypothetical protein
VSVIVACCFITHCLLSVTDLSRRSEPTTLVDRIFELNCLLGDDPRRIFQVKIAATETVGALKDAIKDEKKPELDHVAADSLVLWKVSIAFNGSLEQNLDTLYILKEPSLSPVAKLSEVFSDQLQRCLHIVVRFSAAGEGNWFFFVTLLISTKVINLIPGLRSGCALLNLKDFIILILTWCLVMQLKHGGSAC